MFYILFASRGLKSAHSNSQYSNDSLHVGSSFLPFPSEHFRPADLLFFPSLWNREVFFSTFTLWKYKITQGLSYFQRAEATLASEKSVKSWLIFFFFKCYNENMYKTYPPGLSLWMLVKKKKVDEVRRARGRLRKWESISVAGIFFPISFTCKEILFIWSPFSDTKWVVYLKIPGEKWWLPFMALICQISDPYKWNHNPWEVGSILPRRVLHSVWQVSLCLLKNAENGSPVRGETNNWATNQPIILAQHCTCTQQQTRVFHHSKKPFLIQWGTYHELL